MTPSEHPESSAADPAPPGATDPAGAADGPWFDLPVTGMAGRLIIDGTGVKVIGGEQPWALSWSEVALLWAPDRVESSDGGRAVAVAVLGRDGQLRRVDVACADPREVEAAVRAIARHSGTGPGALDPGPHLAVVVALVGLALAGVAVLLVVAHRHF